jgi:hypothetical protein
MSHAEPIFFRCPVNKTLVQLMVVEEPSHEDHGQFASVLCSACGLVHMVDVTTGETIEDDRHRPTS